jgi:AhpD family alkylhydroperoxidase
VPDPLLQRADPDELPSQLKDAWQRSFELRGDATLFEVFGQHPELFAWYADRFYGELFGGGKVSRQVKELLRLRLSTLHGCRFCNQGNRRDALEAGLEAAKVEAIGHPEAEVFDERDRAVLELAGRLSLLGGQQVIDAELHQRLRHHFSDADILELGMVGGILAGMARFLFAFDLVEREDDCPLHPEEEAFNEETLK